MGHDIVNIENKPSHKDVMKNKNASTPLLLLIILINHVAEREHVKAFPPAFRIGI